ncbi:16S rRNA (cytosine(1402)-N(4))-methyltransferase RsmH [Fulvivirga lutimaris]|uniref:16S rRNA (cytosine(1402)-N(4))-methyltransferase RsmH n=1 Tax=Fulvivirga lutimaris TaxID=1819566 RepID=UPI0012BD3293|nr:16S rRNA (cytosine(1402)-N(4))-methyltransferase RsmH [Fulvivirga lutimaris]MTI41877.1 16S rRNA (cytosine(1402)-N(4))-methyltransferase RsmH [Fulvivirga lutimaris]
MADYEYHQPVMLQECIEGLNIKPNGLYVDLTFGGGGHSKEILKHLDGGHLYGFDQDQDAVKNAESLDSNKFTLIEGNFRYLKRYLKAYGVKQVDGILGDLGISSHQIDDGERGFSTRFDAELDMRMDQSADVTAKTVVNTYSTDALHKLLGMYGEVRNAKTLAAAIAAERINKEIKTVEDLKKILSRFAKRGKENRYYAQVFQAIRIEVNEELKALEEVLVQSEEVLKVGGRLVVMSYHSLEDRMVKNYIAKGKVQGELEKDFYGNVLKPFNAITRKPVEASEEELKINNRARSAKLRIAEKI